MTLSRFRRRLEESTLPEMTTSIRLSVK